MNKLIVSPAPHIRTNVDTANIMRDVVIALLPALVMSIVVFGFRAALLVAVCVASAVGSEWAFQKLNGIPCTVGDYSAVITGLLLAFNLPVTLPLWMGAFGAMVAIVVVKQLFGGIGQNFANPAITARVVLLASFSGEMTTWVVPGSPTSGADMVTGATPLSLISSGDISALPSLGEMFLGNIGGCLGETSALAILIGGAYLLYRKVISPIIPLSFIGTVFVLTAVLGQQPMAQLVSGGLMLGAFFMATDYASSPATDTGRLIFGIGCGILTVLIRVFGNYPEGVSFAILLMNIVAPLISRYTQTKPFGGEA